MEALKKYWQLIAIGILLLTIILLSYFAGDTFSKLKDLRKEKEEYLEVKKEQDSIIKISQEKIVLLQDSIDYLVADGIKINENANYDYKTNISKEKTSLRKKLDDVTNLTVQQQLDLFSKLSANYKPIR